MCNPPKGAWRKWKTSWNVVATWISTRKTWWLVCWKVQSGRIKAFQWSQWVWNKTEWSSHIARMARGTWLLHYSDGKHRNILATRVRRSRESPERWNAFDGGECTAYEECAWKEDGYARCRMDCDLITSWSWKAVLFQSMTFVTCGNSPVIARPWSGISLLRKTGSRNCYNPAGFGCLPFCPISLGDRGW